MNKPSAAWPLPAGRYVSAVQLPGSRPFGTWKEGHSDDDRLEKWDHSMKIDTTAGPTLSTKPHD